MLFRVSTGVIRVTSQIRWFGLSYGLWQKQRGSEFRLCLDDIAIIKSTQKQLQDSKIENLEIGKLVKPKRDRKRKATVSRLVLPQEHGHELEELTDPVDPFGDRGSKTSENSLTDFYQGMKDIIDQYSNRVDGDYIVLFQVGSFYELYFDQATKYANPLGLTLTKKKLKNQDVAFAGFPDYRVEKYLQIIFNLGYKAVICDQKPDQVRNIIDRPIDRLITPGTLIDEGLRDFHHNNFLLSISFPDNLFKINVDSLKIGLCWCDVSLGTFYVLETTFHNLMANVTRINPSEIIINSSIDTESLTSGRWFPDFGDLKKYYITGFTVSSNKKKITDFVDQFSENKKLVTTMLDSLSTKETSAAGFLLHYLDECLPEYKLNFQLPKRSLPKTLMQIDPRAAQDLELTETIRGGFKIGALANVIDRTVTNPGARLLNTWLLAPSSNVKEIQKRQKLISILLNNDIFVDDLIQILKKTADITRIVRRIGNSRAELSEYLELSNTILLLEEIHEMTIDVSDTVLKQILLPVFDPITKTTVIVKLAKRIKKTIDPKVSLFKTDTFWLDSDIVRQNWSVQDTASKRLKALRVNYDDLLHDYKALWKGLIDEFGSYGYKGSLRLIRDARSGEYLVELKSSSKIIPLILKEHNLEYRDKTKSSVKIINSAWAKLGSRMVSLEREIMLEEAVILEDLKQDVLKKMKKFRDVSNIIEILDTSQSFVSLAREKDLVCPKVDNSTQFDIVNGRHLVVEEGLKGRSIGVDNFTSNSCSLESGEGWIITGPNMGGKSTFLRQNAIIAILAQMGSFVPASSAHIGVIDKIFTRVGSSDNIFRHQSTFMVEMNETAIILRDSTANSLAIVDELGRGTSTIEGVSIAFASLARLVKQNKCKVLFATHFGPELERLIEKDLELKENVKFYHTRLSKIQEGDLPIDEKIVFNHKLIEGITYHSHALEIAELAGFPQEALEVAKASYEKMLR